MYVTSARLQRPDYHSVAGDMSVDGKVSSSVCPVTPLLNCSRHMRQTHQYLN